MYGLIILQVILVIACIVLAVRCFADDMPGWGALMIFWALFNTVTCANNIYELKNGDNPRKTVVSQVKEYSIDSTTVINGADTTKTYVITYWK